MTVEIEYSLADVPYQLTTTAPILSAVEEFLSATLVGVGLEDVERDLEGDTLVVRMPTDSLPEQAQDTLTGGIQDRLDGVAYVETREEQ